MQNPYDLIAEQWDAGGRVFRQRRYVDLILEGLERGARVLDVGCGTGRPVAEYLVARGFRVVGLDSSEGMLEIARRAVPGAEFIRGDMAVAEFGEGFAAAVVWDSLFHVPRARHAEVFRKLHAALVPGGRLLLSSGGTGDEGFTSEMYGQTFFYSGFAPEETLALLERAGFEVELCEVDDPSSLGHVAIVARKPARRDGPPHGPENLKP
ncbi:MAG TPA: class I SAM-dependent methyltransferase [Pyrinomonadaceae bacterium]|nr:class I SAM-dependent methyltransferase [Pyrinomonadaceae bacterium]